MMVLGRQPRRGDYSGGVLLVRDGSWTVTVSEYEARRKDGDHWKTVPCEEFFRVDVLRRGLTAAGLPVDVEIKDDGWSFRFRKVKGRVVVEWAAREGRRLKLFLEENYGSFKNRPVSWKWEVRQP